MKLHQLRYVVEVHRHRNHLSAAAGALHTSQPGVSKQIKLLETELGFSVFLRRRNRILGLTEPGERVVEIARRIVHDVESLHAVRRDFASRDEGTLTLATTHTPARYLLPALVERFVARYPAVTVALRQGNPAQVCEMVDTGVADIGIGTETSRPPPGVVMIPCMRLPRSVVARKGHPILTVKRLTLKEIAKYPIITHDPSFSGRWRVMEAFDREGLAPRLMPGIVDADVSKAYVERGLGIAIMASIAVDPTRDAGLRARDLSHLVEPSTLYVSLRRSGYVRRFVSSFVESLAPELTPESIAAAMSAPAGKASQQATTPARKARRRRAAAQ
jgi:LysR family cys regulon transcriptional activator